jgi:hypothetical protein
MPMPNGHGVFVWDHLRWRAPVRQVADPWITLAAVATATEHLRLGPWSRPLPAAGRPRSLGKPRPWTGSAVAASPSVSVSAATASAASCPRPASSLMIGCEARCSTRHWRSSPPPGPVSRCTTAAATTPSRASSSCPDRCSSPGCRCGSQDPRQPQTAAPSRPPRRLLPGQPRTPRSARRDRRHHHRAPPAHDGAVRLRRWSSAWHRPIARYDLKLWIGSGDGGAAYLPG